MNALPYLRSQRKHTAFVVFAALLLWLAVSATHFHASDEAAPESAAACAVCLSLPSAAAPPAALREVVTSVAWLLAAPALTVRAFIGTVVSSYRSRAPPV